VRNRGDGHPGFEEEIDERGDRGLVTELAEGIDGGTLELGLIRDSTLIETNDYELFGETFENVFAVGPTQAAHRLEITACPSGTQAALTTPITCSAT